MRTLILSAFTAAACLSAGIAGAQAGSGSSKKKTAVQEETVVLKSNEKKTIIEIKNGSIYVNGDEMMTITEGNAGTVKKKIIIENGGGSNGNSGSFSPGDIQTFQDFFDKNFSGFDRNFDAPRGAILGVLATQGENSTAAEIAKIVPEIGRAHV